MIYRTSFLAVAAATAVSENPTSPDLLYTNAIESESLITSKHKKDYAYLTLEEIANDNGFRVDRYQVTTDTGYILSLYRIPGTFLEPESDKPPILLQHGLNMDHMMWVDRDVDSKHLAPALVLAKAGYDVWLGDNRGNRFSLGHSSRSADDKKYWQFSWEELGTQDLPAFIEKIQDVTGRQKISYMGHSEGTTQFMAAASLMPDYFKGSIDLAILLAPPAAMANCQNELLNTLSDRNTRKLVKKAADTIKLWSMLPFDYVSSGVAVGFCKLLNGKLCDLVIKTSIGNDPSVNDQNALKVTLSNLPAGAGYLNLVHYAQLIGHDAQVFQRFDYESDVLNLEHYGQIHPPDYDLKAIDLPIALLGGDQDQLADKKDVKWLNEQLGDSVVFYKQYHLGHESFIVAKDMSYFTEDVMSLLMTSHGNVKVCDEAYDGTSFEGRHKFCGTHTDTDDRLMNLEAKITPSKDLKKIRRKDLQGVQEARRTLDQLVNDYGMEPEYEEIDSSFVAPFWGADLYDGSFDRTTGPIYGWNAYQW